MGYSTVAQPFKSFNVINSVVIMGLNGNRIVLQIIWRKNPQCNALRIFYYVCIIYKRVNQIIIIKSIFLGLIEYSLL